MPISASSSAYWPKRRGRRERHGAEEGDVDAARQEQLGGDGHQRDRERAAERVAERRGDAVRAQILDGPAVLDGAGGVEVHLVRRHRGAQQADDEVRVDGVGRALDGRHGAVQRGTPVGPEVDRRDQEDQHRRGRRSRSLLDHAERHRPRDDDERRDRDDDQHAVRPVGQQLQHDRDAAHLRRARHQVHDLRGDQRRRGRRRTRRARARGRRPGDPRRRRSARTSPSRG